MKKENKKKMGRPIKDKKSGKKVSCFTFSLSPDAAKIITALLNDKRNVSAYVSSLVEGGK